MRRTRPADIKEIYALRADTIDYFFPKRDGEINFWTELASKYGEDILHIMCGTGEITIGLAKNGFNVTGLDLTEAMIYKAEERVESENVKNIRIIKDDARYFNLNKKYDFIFISTGDFHHFTDREEIDSFLAKAYAHLRPGGALALELYEPFEKDFKREERKYNPIRDIPDDITVWKRNKASYHSETHMLEIKEELHYEENEEINEGEYEILLRLFPKIEIETILDENGFDEVKHHEGYDFSPYLEEQNSDTWVVIAEKH